MIVTVPMILPTCDLPGTGKGENWPRRGHSFRGLGLGVGSSGRNGLRVEGFETEA